jgi:hypothetical protein
MLGTFGPLGSGATDCEELGKPMRWEAENLGIVGRSALWGDTENTTHPPHVGWWPKLGSFQAASSERSSPGFCQVSAVCPTLCWVPWGNSKSWILSWLCFHGVHDIFAMVERKAFRTWSSKYCMSVSPPLSSQILGQEGVSSARRNHLNSAVQIVQRALLRISHSWSQRSLFFLPFACEVWDPVLSNSGDRFWGEGGGGHT